MKTKFSINSVAAAVLAVTSFGAMADHSEDGVHSTVDVSFRYRIENVDQEGFDDTATASTLRSRATIKTKWNKSVSTVIEFDDVSTLGNTDYNSGGGTSPGQSGFPVIADPEGTEVNQAYLKYTDGDYSLDLGRQRILIGNQRYVGGVGWRQNEQTYDAMTFKNKFGKVDFNYSYIFGVNRIFGEQVPAGDHEHRTHLLGLDYKTGAGKLSGYYLSIDNQDAAGLSNSTLGIKFSGKAGAFAYTAEIASQSDNANNNNDYDANYYLLEGAYKQDNYSFGAGLEVLGGDSENGQAFTTSLATLHKFQGWADVFLATPGVGIEDTYLNATFKAGGFNFKVVYHDFSSEEQSTDFGTELDFSISKKLSTNWSGLLKYADFDSDDEDLYTSRQKIWLMFTYKL